MKMAQRAANCEYKKMECLEGLYTKYCRDKTVGHFRVSVVERAFTRAFRRQSGR